MAVGMRTKENVKNRKERINLIIALLVKGHSSGYGFNKIVKSLNGKKGWTTNDATISKDVKKALSMLDDVKAITFSKTRVIMTLEKMLDDVTNTETDSAREEFEKVNSKLRVITEINKLEGHYNPSEIKIYDDPFTEALIELNNEKTN